MRCRTGGSIRNRNMAGTCNSYRLPAKTHKPIASVAALPERHWQLQIWRHSRRMCNASKFVIARPQRGRGNLGKAVAFSPMSFLRCRSGSPRGSGCARPTCAAAPESRGMHPRKCGKAVAVGGFTKRSKKTSVWVLTKLRLGGIVSLALRGTEC